MKASYIILGFCIIAVSLFFLNGKLQLFKIEQQGEVVKMQINSLPSNCGITRAKYYANFSYQGIVYNKRIPVGFCDKHKVGELVEMKYLADEEYILFPDEKIRNEFIAIGLFLLIGIVSIIFGTLNQKVKPR